MLLVLLMLVLMRMLTLMSSGDVSALCVTCTRTTQVRLVDMVQDQMVASLDEREAAVTTRPNSVREQNTTNEAQPSNGEHALLSRLRSRIFQRGNTQRRENSHENSKKIQNSHESPNARGGASAVFLPAARYLDTGNGTQRH